MFTSEQYDLVKKQLLAHNRDPKIRTIVLDEDNSIFLRLLIENGVFGSDIVTTATHLARFLYQHREIYLEKEVADIGCGPGTQGIVMLKYGAKSVAFSDIDPNAIANVKKNIYQQNLTNTEIYGGDLFDNFPRGQTYDLIVFNHPFFSGDSKTFVGDPTQNEMLRGGMLGGTDLLPRFLENVKTFLKPGGIIVMPYFHFAGSENNPANHVNNYGLKIFQEHKIESKEGFHQGNISIYLISKAN